MNRRPAKSPSARGISPARSDRTPVSLDDEIGISERLSAIEKHLSAIPEMQSRIASIPSIESKLSALPSIEAKLDAVMRSEMFRQSGTNLPRNSNLGTKLDTEKNADFGDHVEGHVKQPAPKSFSAVLTPSRTTARPPSSPELNSSDEEEYVATQVEKEGEDKVSIIVESDAGMINPKNRFRMSWDLGVVMPLLVYLTVAMPFRLTFANEAPQFTYMYWFEFVIDMLFIVDIFLNFRTGFFLGDAGGSEETQSVEYDRVLVAQNYMKTWFVLDVVSGVPFALLELVMSNGSGDSPLKSAKALKLLRFLKLGRLLKMEKILSNLDRDTLDVIEDFFQNGTTRSAVMMLKLIFYLAYAAHLMSCGFVLVGKAGDSAGVDNWLAHEIRGPFTSEDTTGINGDDPVYSIYIAAFYFSLTTMTSVGYGDIITRNNLERLYVISLEFLGAIIFATVIAAITSVVTSMDMNARKTAEELDAVSSYVALRQFPTLLARQIRRHFRHFYSRKSAIDESKIFSELSTRLRTQVSEYLVTEILGEQSFFKHLIPSLWPRLLPRLRPMGFEQGEVICKRDDEASEMYVVISGVFTGTLKVGDEERVRHITIGESINSLLVLGVWTKCVETVEAATTGETYAISEQDFSSLFSSEVECASLLKLTHREVRKFKMEPSKESDWGKPLYFLHFSRVQFSVKQVSGSFLPVGDHSKRKSFGDVKSWVVVDLVHAHTGVPFNEFWRYTTPKASPSEARSEVDGRLTGDLVFEEKDTTGDNADADAALVRWTDISVPFADAALRVRLFVGDRRGVGVLAGWGTLSLQDIESSAKSAVFGNRKGGGSVDRPVPTKPEIETKDAASSPSPAMELSAVDTWLTLSKVPLQAVTGSAATKAEQRGGAASTSLFKLLSSTRGGGGTRTRDRAASESSVPPDKVRLQVLASPREKAPRNEGGPRAMGNMRGSRMGSFNETSSINTSVQDEEAQEPAGNLELTGLVK